MYETTRRGGKKNRKHGRNTVKCEKYRKMKKREHSRIRRIKRHIERYKDSSPMALNALKKWQELLKA